MNKWWVGVLLCIGTQAVAADCRYEQTLDRTLDVTNAESLRIIAAAGDLVVTGIADAQQVSITVSICASKKAWLNQARLETRADTAASIEMQLPERGTGFSFFGRSYIYADLVLEVPADLALEIRDSSGDTELKRVGALQLDDSSGDILINEVNGRIEINDSSGDIRLNRVRGELTITDSSGDVVARDISGSVRVVSDSSGDLRFRDVAGSVLVENDSSGDIVTARIGGDVTVLKDGSGDIRTDSVLGQIKLP